MIDNFALALSHGLILLAAWRLVSRTDLDDEAALPPSSPSAAAKAGSRFRSPFKGRRDA
jgi:hypothetical protein